MAAAQQIPKREMMRGDTWNGFRVLGVQINAANPPSAAVSAVLEFFGKELPLQAKHTIRSGAGIAITNPATWAMTVAATKLPLGMGEWEYRLRVRTAAGPEKTYVRGTLSIL